MTKNPDKLRCDVERAAYRAMVNMTVTREIPRVVLDGLRERSRRVEDQ